MSEIQSTNAMTFQNPPNPAEKSANDAVAGYSERDFSKGAQPMLRRRFRLGESLVQGFLFACGALSILTTLGIIYTLGHDALNFFLTPEVTLTEFFGTKVSLNSKEKNYSKGSIVIDYYSLEDLNRIQEMMDR